MGSTTSQHLFSINCNQWTNQQFDLIVIGGGIYGACAARDAALRGLSVLLLEKNDFGSATSGNSHKILHGGLRYLQHLDVRRMRESICERRTAMKIAPHLTRPMPFVIPTYASITQSKWLFSLVLKINDLVGFDRNRHLPHDKQLPASRVISASEIQQICPSLHTHSLTGGAMFYDAQVSNPERYILSILQSAATYGAKVANYADVKKVKCFKGKPVELHVWDERTQREMIFHARIVVNCAGPWVTRFLPQSHLMETKLGRIRWLKAIVLVTRPLTNGVAIGVPGRFEFQDLDAVIKKGFRYFFITPWRNRSLIGTFQRPYLGDPDTFEIRSSDIQELIQEINRALPRAMLKQDDVYFVNRGLLPMDREGAETEEAQWLKQYIVYDHAHDGVEGFISIIGVKFTTARHVAEKAIDLVVKKLRKPAKSCRTHSVPVYGGEMEEFESFKRSALQHAESSMSIPTTVLENLVRTYGTRYQEILQYGFRDKRWLDPICSEASVIQGQILHAVREEMAWTLSDVIFRRTGLGTAGYPGEECLKQCAKLMGQELGWDHQRVEKEIQDVKNSYTHRGINLCPMDVPCASW